MSQREAAANSLVAIIPIAVVGAATYYAMGSGHQVSFGHALALGVGSIIGAVAGARISHLVPDRALRVAFGIVLLVSAVRLLFPGGV
jgi:uncharacterized membrane protein YfcA